MKAKIEQSPATSPNPIISVEKDGIVLYSNKAGESLLHEWDVEIGGKLPQTFGDLVQRAISLNIPEKLEVKVENIAYLIVFDPVLNKECVNISGFEISDQDEFEEKLQKSERKYRLLFENMLDGFAYCKLLYDNCEYPVDFIYLDTNRAFEQLTGLKKVNGKRATEVFPGIKESHPELLEIYYRVVLTGKPEKFEIEFKPLGIWLSISVYSMEKEHFIAVFDNITERKRVERALQASEARQKVVEAVEAERQRLFAMLDSLPVMVCLLTLDYHVAFANQTFREKFGELDSRHCYEYCFGLTKPCDFCQAYKVLETGQPHHWEVITPGGSVIDAYDFPFTDVDGSQLILEMDIDITERKKAEEALANIETARKKEIHHRIKNNLQVISSLLDLTAEKFNNREGTKNLEVLEAFKESQDRVMSMALIHEELYKGGEINTLDFSSYLKKLTENLFQTYSLGNIDITLNMDLDENIFYDMDIAVPLGMIVNELVSNSFKYAFPDRNKGEIQIKLCREENEECKIEDCNTTFVLTVSDKGVGMPENIDIENLNSLGLQLVTTLVDQLDGELELKRNNGTEFNIRFSNGK